MIINFGEINWGNIFPHLRSLNPVQLTSCFRERMVLQNSKKGKIKQLAFEFQKPRSQPTRTEAKNTQKKFGFCPVICFCYIIIKLKFYLSLGPWWLKCKHGLFDILFSEFLPWDLKMEMESVTACLLLGITPDNITI